MEELLKTPKAQTKKNMDKFNFMIQSKYYLKKFIRYTTF